MSDRTTVARLRAEIDALTTDRDEWQETAREWKINAELADRRWRNALDRVHALEAKQEAQLLATRPRRWFGTGAYMVGMVLTALNVYPANLIFGALGGAAWALVGTHYRDRALVLVELAAAGIYLLGLLKWWLV